MTEESFASIKEHLDFWEKELEKNALRKKIRKKKPFQ